MKIEPLKYAPGTFAFFDTFSGCIPCKVLSVEGAPGNSSNCKVTIQLTAKRGAYLRGEVLESNALWVIPRPHVRGNRIFGNYAWIPA